MLNKDYHRPRYWFGRNTHARGWHPVSWQGWLITLAYWLVILCGGWWVAVLPGGSSGLFFFFAIPATAVLLTAWYTKGEPATPRE